MIILGVEAALELANVYARIVAAETRCPCGGAWDSDEAHLEAGYTQACHNTGTVAVLPLLRELCVTIEANWHRCGQSEHSARDCPGYKAKPLSFETVWAALLDAGYHVHVDARPGELTEAYVYSPFAQRWDDEATTPLEALLGATAKAIGVER